MIDKEELEALIKEEGDFLPVEHEGYEGMCLRMVDGGGNINGFVKIPEGHKLHGIDCDDDTFPNLNVHGGITFSLNYNLKTKEKDEWWIGFDTSHNGDYMPYYTHFDGEEYRDMQYVEQEIINLINQLIEIEQKKNEK